VLFLCIDLSFKALIIPAHQVLIGPRSSAGAPRLDLYLPIAAVAVTVWQLVVLWLARDVERWRAASASGRPSEAEILRAAQAAQHYPQRMTLAWACEWPLLFGAVTYLGGTPSALASGFFLATMASGPLPLAHSFATWLIGPVMREISVAARERRVVIPRAPVNLRRRLAFYCVTIGVAPVLYMSALALAVHAHAAQLEHLLPTVLIFLAAIVLFALICAVFLSATITGPVAEMATLMRDIARQGDVARAGRVPLYQGDEVGDLAQVTNQMVDRLELTETKRAAAAAALASLNQTLERRVEDRTGALSSRNDQMRLVLDNVEQGLFTVDQAGGMSSEHSAILATWFGPLVPNEPFFHYFGRHEQAFGAQLEMAWSQVQAGVLPLQLTLAQMPKHLARNGQHYRFSYAPIGGAERGPIERFLVVVSDQTRRVEHEILQRERNETMAVFEHILADRTGFIAFMDEASEIVARIVSGGRGADSVELRRELHTLKGNAALFGLRSVAEQCHQLESLLAEEGIVAGGAALGELQDRWSRLSADVGRLLGDGRRLLEVQPEKLVELERALRRGTPTGALIEMVHDLALEPVEPRLRHFAERAREIGQRFGKEITASISHDGLRLDAYHWSRFWQAFVHSVHNAVDHGIEPVDERLAAGKPGAGRIDLRCRRDAGAVVIEIEDDGRGIPWDEIQRRVGGGARGPRQITRRELTEALYVEGVSTARELTEISGRGVGMGALHAAVVSLGGALEIDSEPGRGTRLSMRFPESSLAPASR